MTIPDVVPDRGDGLGPWQPGWGPGMGAYYVKGSIPYAIDEALGDCAYVDMETNWEPSVACDAVSLIERLRELGVDVVFREQPCGPNGGCTR